MKATVGICSQIAIFYDAIDVVTIGPVRSVQVLVDRDECRCRHTYLALLGKGFNFEVQVRLVPGGGVFLDDAELG